MRVVPCVLCGLLGLGIARRVIDRLVAFAVPVWDLDDLQALSEIWELYDGCDPLSFTDFADFLTDLTDIRAL